LKISSSNSLINHGDEEGDEGRSPSPSDEEGNEEEGSSHEEVKKLGFKP
jgi:hypothetical protein